MIRILPLARLEALVTPRIRILFFLLGDIALLLLSMVAAVWLRYDGRVPAVTWSQVPLALALSLAIRLPVFAWQRLYAMSWSQVGLEDMVSVFRGVTLGTLMFWLVVLPLKQTHFLAGFSRSILLLDYVITLYSIGAFRMARRISLHVTTSATAGERPALIVGAGAAGEQLARSLRQAPTAEYRLVGFVDDNPNKWGTVIHGLPVLGGRDRLPEMIREHGIQAVLIAMPSAPSRVIRNVVSATRDAGVREIRNIPGLDRFLSSQISFTDLRELQLTDLLGRSVVRIDEPLVEEWLRDQTVLVTGAGGSIGSELCSQISQFHPRDMILVDWEETNLFWIDQELKRRGQRATPVLTDIREASHLRDIFAESRPAIVFHAAAYKHVGLTEHHPEQAIYTNVLGTLQVARAALEAGVDKFILISTDKAVRPTSVMGVTKRVAEQLCFALNGRGHTRYIAVRFGNVLGSRGSVIPVFQERIRRGEPVTVRGPNMRRYFMATSEAVLLVLQAGAMGQGGEIFVLDMGEQVRVIDLAKDLIRLTGLEPEKDVPIVFADPEPGEKEQEDLLTAGEGTVATRHDRIFVTPGQPSISPDVLFSRVASLEAMVRAGDHRGVVEVLQVLVPSYRASELMLSKTKGTLPV
jgi:FlaA1/EpsC-like NDP-sugar epimerase